MNDACCETFGRKRHRCQGTSISRVELAECHSGRGVCVQMTWDSERCFTPEYALETCAKWWGDRVGPSDIAHMLDRPYMPDIDDCAPSRFVRAYLALTKAFGTLTRPGDAPEPLLQAFEDLLSDVWAQLSEDDIAFARMFTAAPDAEDLRASAYMQVPGNRPKPGRKPGKTKKWR